MKVDNFNFKEIDAKWQKIWADRQVFAADIDDARPKYYCLVMFPYPSGKIHMGHARNYCIGDILARYKKMRGFNVLHPLGWDAFGLPAENAAIERHIHPNTWTRQNILDMRQDIQSLGISYDWRREFATCDPEYYKWNQWFFIQMFKKGLAYKKKSSVNWCPQCQTVLANEQVHEGHCWRCRSEVAAKELEQWFFKITDYAERLLDDSKLLEGKWPEEVISMQRNWIGKSDGAEIDFEVLHDGAPKLRVFTTRADTLFGCTFVVVSPEHALVQMVLNQPAIAAKLKQEILNYCAQAKQKSRLERTTQSGQKSGVFSGIYAVNPVNKNKVPVWIADYVLGDYGTGAVMAVPAHDQRDYDFAKQYHLEVKQVIRPPEKEMGDFAFEGDGILINSNAFDGLDNVLAKQKITVHLENNGQGQSATTFRLRDWLISRQRYWGTPIPIIYCPKCGLVPESENNLPVRLPEDVKFTGKGQSPLSQVPSFVNAKCPQCGADSRRETDTMDTFVDSSWYFLRYCDAKNNAAAFDRKASDYWMSADQYIGGIEHACMHLVYSRFFHKVIFDLGMTKEVEPFAQLLTQGMVTLGGSAMSKSKGNIVAVEEMSNRYGADTARVFILFASPPKNQLEWSEDGVQGCWRFLNRIWRLAQQMESSATVQTADNALALELLRKTHFTIKKVGEDIERDFHFNTAISALMELLNVLSGYPSIGDIVSREAFQSMITLLFPFAPHISSEIWEMLKFAPKNLYEVAFPEYRKEYLVESVVEIIVQANGRLKGKIIVDAPESKNEEKILALAKTFLETKNIASTSIHSHKFVPGRLINFVLN